MSFYNPARKERSAKPSRFRAALPPRKMSTAILFLIIGGFTLAFDGSVARADTATAQGELQKRPAPVARRKCLGGPNAGNLCNGAGGCPGSTCMDHNIFNISVAVQFDATPAELTTIKNLISAGSATLFDITDGQAQIGEAFIYNNAFGTGSDADLRIYPSATSVWWKAGTGLWQVGGSIHVSMNYVNTASNPGELWAHEFVHLVFDARDEYQDATVGCTDSGDEGTASCPDAAAIAAGAARCLMDGSGSAGDHSELCWGQGDSTNLTDLSGGNHDAKNVTEQSRCRSNRSCWDQIVWSWPDVFLAPTGAPDPAANGATVDATQFVMVDDTLRVVLVLDESGTMSLESPTRLERLKVAAKDFVALAENNTELGIVSYSDDAEASSGRVNVAIAALGADRSTWTNAIDSLAPHNWTNIGAGLQKAMDMIATAGGVTGNTCIILMTDGLNNRPAPQSNADADLQAKIDDLLALGIPAYVTCTGGELGTASQCSKIATGTGGFYVDSADSARLAEAFVDLHERSSNRDAIGSFTSWTDADDGGFYVEEGSESATFALVWQEPGVDSSMTMIDPANHHYDSTPMPQGRFVRVKNPMPGQWQMVTDFKVHTSNRFVKRAYSRNQIHSLGAGVRYAETLPGTPIYIYAYPRSIGGPVTNIAKRISGTVRLPDGKMDVITLSDVGHLFPGGGDDIPEDGVFTGIYRNTGMKGPYQFLLQADIDGWGQATDRLRPDLSTRSPRFQREVRVSTAVGDPNDVPGIPPEGDPNKPENVRGCVPLPAYVITVTASSFTPGQEPEHTIDGSGVNEDNQHSTDQGDMWLTLKNAPGPAWIQYEFDRVYKLCEMRAWNYNSPLDPVIGLGCKDVAIEYSLNGTDWTSLGTVQFARALGEPDCVPGLTVNFGGTAAKYVRLAIKSNWGGMVNQYGLSEVRFYHLPVYPSDPRPRHEEGGVLPYVILRWQSGRQAAAHEVYLSTSLEDVANGTARVATVFTNSYDAAGLNLQLGTTYYWKVIEVNQVETPSTWEGPIWKFTTRSWYTIDNFESYTNDSPHRVFQTWIDGLGFSGDEYLPGGSKGNGTGAIVGYEPETGEIMEKTIVHGGRQAMPLEYNNVNQPYFSETPRSWDKPQDWTIGGADTLQVCFQGRATQTVDHLLGDRDRFYVVLQDSAGHTGLVTHSDPGAVLWTVWQTWHIPLADFRRAGVNTAAIKKMYLGVGDREKPFAGAAGTVFVDDIAFGRSAPTP